MANYVWPFLDSGGGGGGVTDLNGLTGSVTLIPGTNVAFTPTGNGFTIDVTGGSGTVTGTGAAFQVAYWDSATDIAGDNRFEFDPTTGALLLVDAVQNIKIGNTTNQSAQTISIGVGNNLSATAGQTINIGNGSTGNAGGNNTLVGNNIVADGTYTGSIVLGDESHLTANFQMVFGAQSGANMVTSFVIHGDSYDVATNFSQQEGFLLNSSTNKWSWSGIKTDATMTGAGTVSSPLSVVATGVLPVYPTNEIVFGDGTTPGGVTSPNLTHDTTTETTSITTPFVSGARTINSFGPGSVTFGGSTQTDQNGGGFSYFQIDNVIHRASFGVNAPILHIHDRAGVAAIIDNTFTTELHFYNQGIDWTWAASASAGFASADGSNVISFNALSVDGTTITGDGITTPLSVVGSGSATLINHQIGFGDASNLMTSSPNLTYDAASTLFSKVDDGAGNLSIFSLNSTIATDSIFSKTVMFSGNPTTASYALTNDSGIATSLAKVTDSISYESSLSLGFNDAILKFFDLNNSDEAHVDVGTSGVNISSLSSGGNVLNQMYTNPSTTGFDMADNSTFSLSHVGSNIGLISTFTDTATNNVAQVNMTAGTYNATFTNSSTFANNLTMLSNQTSIQFLDNATNTSAKTQWDIGQINSVLDDTGGAATFVAQSVLNSTSAAFQFQDLTAGSNGALSLSGSEANLGYSDSTVNSNFTSGSGSAQVSHSDTAGTFSNNLTLNSGNVSLVFNDITNNRITSVNLDATGPDMHWQDLNTNLVSGFSASSTATVIKTNDGTTQFAFTMPIRAATAGQVLGDPLGTQNLDWVTITGSVPALSQFHIYSGDVTNSPVDSGTGFTYDALTGFTANATNGSTFSNSIMTNGSASVMSFTDTGSAKVNQVNLSPSASYLGMTDGSTFDTRAQVTPSDAHFFYQDISGNTLSEVNANNGGIQINARNFTSGQTSFFFASPGTAEILNADGSTYSNDMTINSSGYLLNHNESGVNRATTFQVSDQLVQFGTLSNGNNTSFTLSDSAQTYTLNKLGGSGNKFVTTNNSGVLGIISAPIISASADINAATTTISSVATVTPSADTTYNVSSYLNVTAITAGTILLTITFTDIHSVSQTLTMTGITATGYVSYPVQTVRAKSGTAVTVVSTFTGVSTTYDVGARIVAM